MLMPSRRNWLIGAALGLAGCPAIAADAPLRIAITVDDLPVHGGYPTGVSPQQAADQMIAALKAEGVPAYGFVNAAKIEENPASGAALANWRAAGLKLGNHGW